MKINVTETDFVACVVLQTPNKKVEHIIYTCFTYLYKTGTNSCLWSTICIRHPFNCVPANKISWSNVFEDYHLVITKEMITTATSNAEDHFQISVLLQNSTLQGF
jgi:hypothetical protein